MGVVVRCAVCAPGFDAAAAECVHRWGAPAGEDHDRGHHRVWWRFGRGFVVVHHDGARAYAQGVSARLEWEPDGGRVVELPLRKGGAIDHAAGAAALVI